MGCFTFRGTTYHVDGKLLAMAGAEGRGWYREAQASIEAYAREHELCPKYISDVLAILSPRVSVAFNVTLAKRYLLTGFASGAMGQRQKALEKYERTGYFSGRKVVAFSAALSGDPSAIVIDAWMYNALGDPEVGPSKGHYERCCARVLEVADALGWPPAETQAAIWRGTRALVGFTQEGSMRL